MSLHPHYDEPLEILVKGGRFRVPSVFVLPKSTLVLTAAPGPCLLLFKPQDWEPVRDKLLSFSVSDDSIESANMVALRRLLVGNARDLEVTARNVIEIAQELASYAHIQGRLIWATSVIGVELWNRRNFDPLNRLCLFARRTPKKPLD